MKKILAMALTLGMVMSPFACTAQAEEGDIFTEFVADTFMEGGFQRR